MKQVQIVKRSDKSCIESGLFSDVNHHHEIDGEHQVVSVNGKEFVADTEMIGLLTELNLSGLSTTKHCCGHGAGIKFIGIDLSAIESIEFREKIKGAQPKRGTRLVREFVAGGMGESTEIVMVWKHKKKE